MIEISGLRFLRALTYAAKAIPTEEASSRFQHLGLMGNMLLGADGERWFAGLLGDDIDLPPMVIARKSVLELLLDLDYCRKKSGRRNGTFSVQIDDTDVRVLYGADQPIVHHLAVVNLGPLPKRWIPPVPEDAPLLAGGGSDLRCGHMKQAMSWHCSWEEDFGSWCLKGAGGRAPVRVDVTADGERVATAWLLPLSHPKAQLPLDEPVFEHGMDPAEKKSQSIFDLDLSGDGKPRPNAKAIKIGDREIDVTGLANADALLREGPCLHRDLGACFQCTEEAVEQAKREALMEEEGDDLSVDDGEAVPTAGKKKRKTKKAAK